VTSSWSFMRQLHTHKFTDSSHTNNHTVNCLIQQTVMQKPTCFFSNPATPPLSDDSYTVNSSHCSVTCMANWQQQTKTRVTQAGNNHKNLITQTVSSHWDPGSQRKWESLWSSMEYLCLQGDKTQPAHLSSS